MSNCQKMAIGLLTLLLVSGCSGKTETSAENQVVIRVDNRVLTLAEFNEYFETVNTDVAGENDQDGTAIREARLRFLLQLVEEMIILRRADELDLSISPQELDAAVHDIQKDYPKADFEDIFLKQAVTFEVWRERLEKRLLMEKVMRQELLKEDSVTPEEVSEYYDRHREEWNQGEEIRARHILLPTEDEAKKVLEGLQQGDAFATLARRHSIAPEAQYDGDMGYVIRGQLPSCLEDPLFKLKTGDVSSVIKTPYGFHIFQVLEKRESSVPDIEESIERIKQGILKERLEAGFGPWLAKLRSRYHIEINTEMI